jgi:hypothetical protein
MWHMTHMPRVEEILDWLARGEYHVAKSLIYMVDKVDTTDSHFKSMGQKRKQELLKRPISPVTVLVHST